MNLVMRDRQVERSKVEPLKFLSPEEVRSIAQQVSTPCFVYDEATIESNAHYMRTLPNIYGLTVRFSIKSCPNGAILRLVDRLGLHFDASSIWEVRRAIRAGVDPAKILLTGQEAGDGVIDLIRQGVKFDAGSLIQLDMYGRAFPGAEVSIRINPGFGSGLVRRLTSGGPHSSFGIWHEDLPEVKAIADRHGLKVVRAHIHIGSGHDAAVLVRCVSKILEVVEDFEDVAVVNLGGGYKVKAMIDDPVYDHHEMAAIVRERLAEYGERTGRKLHLEVEPGTFIMANAGSIIARVIDVTDTGADGHRFLKIDAGLTEIIRPSYYGAPHPLVSVPADGDAREETGRYCVAGHCCIAGDVLTPRPGDVETLQEMVLARTEPGDFLVIERAGGYCSSMALRNFNSYPDAPELLRRKDGSLQVIRSRQTLDQIVQNERIPDDIR